MVGIQGYHRHVINLQGITYVRDEQNDQRAKVLCTTISAQRNKMNQIFYLLPYGGAVLFSYLLLFRSH